MTNYTDKLQRAETLHKKLKDAYFSNVMHYQDSLKLEFLKLFQEDIDLLPYITGTTKKISGGDEIIISIDLFGEKVYILKTEVEEERYTGTVTRKMMPTIAAKHKRQVEWDEIVFLQNKKEMFRAPLPQYSTEEIRSALFRFSGLEYADGFEIYTNGELKASSRTNLTMQEEVNKYYSENREL